MDTIDKSGSNLPVQLSAALSPATVSGLPLQRDLVLSSSPQVNSHVILRGLTRHGWRILLMWLVISTPVVYLIWNYVEPTYEAFSLLHFEPTRPVLYDPSQEHAVNLRSIERYLQTQVNIILSDKVLKEAVANPAVVKLAMIKGSSDPKADLRKEMTVEIVQDADLIRISLESTDPREAAVIVRAVVDSYMAQNLIITQSTNKKLQVSLEKQHEGLSKRIDDAKKRLGDLIRSGHVDLVEQAPPRFSSSQPTDDPAQPTVSNLTQTHYSGIVNEVIRTDIELIGAEALLQAKREAEKSAQAEHEQQSQQVDEELETQIAEEFRKDPDVIALKDRMEEVREQRDKATSLARKSSDPSRRAAEREYRKLEDEYQELWDLKKEEIRKRLLASATGPQPYETLAQVEEKVKILKNKKESQKKLLDKIHVDKQTTNSDTFKYADEHYELTSLLNAREVVRKYIQQVDFQANHDPYHVTVVDDAREPKIPSNNKRLKYMAAAPVGVLFSVLGLFLLLEIKAQRVADPDHLSTRIRSEVHALPPLPTARSMRKMRALGRPEADAHIQQFTSRLDHVRFAVCGNIPEAGKGRCVLITSAIGGEGKTTLAAQLAARCGSAGMSTLLIDADLHRTDLCRVLDIPEGPGLSDVLKDEAVIGDVIIPVQGGTFNLLRAGTPIHDTSRVLQASKFSLLIAQLRQLYDLIIIDSPPVLPVPDALILGRWADGAVLAARYDISRLHQIEKARRQLDGAGIAVLGTVINGMRNADAYYGRYTYSRRQTPQPDPFLTS
jgi:capsular exopolysaccharide synthesis family protein